MDDFGEIATTKGLIRDPRYVLMYFNMGISQGLNIVFLLKSLIFRKLISCNFVL